MSEVTLTPEQIAKLMNAGDVVTIEKNFNYSADWNTREWLAQALREMVRQNLSFDVELMKKALRDIIELCEAEVGGGTYQTNCIRMAKTALNELPTSIESLIETLKDKDGVLDPNWPYSEAAKLIVPDFISALKDRNYTIRESAIEVLEKIDPNWPISEAARLIVPDFISALKDKEGVVRKAATNALEKIDPNWPYSEAAKLIVPDFISALKDKDSGIRQSAIEVLEKIDSNWPISEAARLIVPDIISALKDRDSGIRQSAIEVLEKIDPNWPSSEEAKKAVPDFIATLKDIDGWRSILDIRDDDENSGVRKFVYEVLVLIGTAAVKPLISLLTDKDYWVVLDSPVESAVEALDKIGEPALASLIMALKDNDYEVQWAAASALGEIRAAQCRRATHCYPEG